MKIENGTESSNQSYANIAAHLPEMARLQPDTPAIYIPKQGQGQTEYDEQTRSAIP